MKNFKRNDGKFGISDEFVDLLQLLYLLGRSSHFWKLIKRRLDIAHLKELIFSIILQFFWSQ